ncbi:hypothetical protein niasHT_019180 [Heterodera trifolii]|uniref:Uncharacterized protein n=1 Tax=Heterodera trifolii TaxID=157864 RepID=A0ABD2L0G7_9BILA
MDGQRELIGQLTPVVLEEKLTPVPPPPDSRLPDGRGPAFCFRLYFGGGIHKILVGGTFTLPEIKRVALDLLVIQILDMKFDTNPAIALYVAFDPTHPRDNSVQMHLFLCSHYKSTVRRPSPFWSGPDMRNTERKHWSRHLKAPRASWTHNSETDADAAWASFWPNRRVDVAY